jgi:hypothetical protein
MIESYDIESFEQVVEKKRVRGFEPMTPFAFMFTAKTRYCQIPPL